MCLETGSTSCDRESAAHELDIVFDVLPGLHNAINTLVTTSLNQASLLPNAADQHIPLCTSALAEGISICTIDASQDDANLKIYMQSHPAFVNAVFAFLFASRTEENLRRLKKKLSACHCSSYPLTKGQASLLHERRAITRHNGCAKNEDISDFDDLSQMLFTFAGSIVRVMSSSWLKRKLRHKRTSADQKASLSQAASFVLEEEGITLVLNACRVWIKVMPAISASLKFVITCFKCAPKAFYPQFFAQPTLLHELVKGLQSSVAPIKKGRTLTQELYESQELIVDLLYQVFFSLGTAADAELSACFAPHAHILHDHFTCLLRYTISHLVLGSEGAKGLRVAAAVDKLCLSASVVHKYIPAGQESPELDGQIVSWNLGTHRVLNFEVAQRGYYWLLCAVLEQVEQVRKCYNPDCDQEVTASIAKLFHCAGCKAVTYCSRQCQRNAWSYESCPHRNVCKTISVLKDVQLEYPYLECTCLNDVDRLIYMLALKSNSPSGSGLELEELRQASKHGDPAAEARLIEAQRAQVKEVNEYVRNMLVLLKKMDERRDRVEEPYWEYRLVHDKRWMKAMLEAEESGDAPFLRVEADVQLDLDRDYVVL